jgi:TPR repeat protein
MKLPPALLIVGMLAVSGWAEEAKLIPISAEPYSAELVKKAKAGDASAQRNLGVCYGGGQGVGKDEKEAVKWFTKAAEQGEMHAQTTLGFCYRYGIGVTKDEKEAVKWFTKSAEQGEANAKKALEYLKSK